MWLEVRASTLCIHLRDCPLVTDQGVKEHAVREIQRSRHDQGSGSGNITQLQEAAHPPEWPAGLDIHQTPRASRTYRAPDTQEVVSPRPIHYNQQPPNALIAQWQYTTAPGRPASAASMRVDSPALFGSTVSYNPSALNHDLARHSAASPAPTIQSMGSFRSDHTSLSASSFSGRPAKYSRSASGLKRPSSSAFGNQAPWDDNKQRQFEGFIAKLTASAGFSFSWVGNPEFVKFCQEFLPGAKVPSRRVLSNRILPTMLKTVRDNIREQVRGGLATVQCDGWTGSNNHHLVAFMVTVGTNVSPSF